MPSIYTIEGTRRKKRMTTSQRRFRRAAKKCKGKRRRAFQACMKRELKR